MNMIHKIKNTIKIEHAAVLFIAILLTNLLFVKPITGVADNGDFGRIMGSTGLRYIPQDSRDRYFEFVNRTYISTNPFKHYSGYFSSEIPVVIAAKVINDLFFPHSETFDIRFLAFIYLLIFLVSICLLIKCNRTNRLIIDLVLVSLVILVFTDAGYMAYFNSLYGESLSFISLLSTIAFAFCLSRYDRPPIHILLGFFISAAFLTGAKLQNVPVGIVLVIFGIRLAYLRKCKAWKQITTVSSLLIVCIMAISYISVPDNIKVCNKYQSVFFGILKGSDTPGKDLKEFGLEEELAVLAGTNFFMKRYPVDIKDPAFMREISEKISPVKVAVFYAKNPGRYIKKLNVTAKNAFRLIQGFGNYEKEYSGGRKRIVQSNRIWSDFKMRIIPHSLILLVLLFIGYYAVLLYYHQKSRNISARLKLEIFMLIGIIGAIQFIVPVIGDGEADLSKHLFLFNVCFDIVFISSICWLINMSTMLFDKYILKLKSSKADI